MHNSHSDKLALAGAMQQVPLIRLRSVASLDATFMEIGHVQLTQSNWCHHATTYV